MTEIVPLSLLSRGDSARIADVGGDPRVVHRLRELGLHEGVSLQMLQPGRPCIIALGSQRLSLRSEFEDQILVEVLRG
ncbi:MAG: ferrous iron transport protein A [Planctomycetaceae bacterium]